MKPRFEPEPNPAISPESEARSLDSEAYDASQVEFAATGDKKPRLARGRFVVDREEGQVAGSPRAAPPETFPAARATGTDPTPVVEAAAAPGCAAAEEALPVRAAEAPAATERQSWRLEVQARITLYRRRKRPSPPRYPSLAMPSQSSRSDRAPGSTLESPASTAGEAANPQAIETASAATTTGGRGKLLQFFRSSIAPPQAIEELAEPVVDSPPILEVPDVLPPPPALGGILIEPGEPATPKKRPGLPLRTAPMVRRIVALLVDSLLVVAAVGLFTYISAKMGLVGLPRKEILWLAPLLTALLWAGYQYLLLVYAGTTPGLRLAKLRLSRFDSTPVPRGLRRWRVLASLLSALSLTLGYAWCFLDEDQLCWHDRITQTYMAPVEQK